MPDIIDIAILVGNRVVEKEREKVKKYQELRRELAIAVSPVVITNIGTLGVV